ncbi:MAG: inositol 2-dehydrogenase [Actinomycetota bacterium]|nr:inositol 2-dehydrogenase [Actinomycetota bacterium]
MSTVSPPATVAAAAATRKLGVGLVGTGRIGRLHADVIDRQVDGLLLTSVFDPVREAAEEVASAHGSTVAPDDLSLIQDPQVDVVAICSSTDTHAQLIVEAAAAGKAIFCEKPVSLDLAEVDRALAAVTRAGVPFMVGFNRRFDAAHGSVEAAVRDGKIGEVHLLRISSRDPAPPPIEYVRVSGGIFLDMMIHDFDMARFVTGSEVVEVFARGAVRIDPAIGDAGDVDTAVVTLTHANGCITAIDNSRQAVYGFDQRVEAFGSLGVSSSLNPPAHTGVTITAEGISGPPLPWFFLDRYVPTYVNEWRAFLQALTAGGPSPVGVRDARMPLAIGLAAGRSLAEGRPVRVEEIEAGS